MTTQAELLDAPKRDSLHPESLPPAEPALVQQLAGAQLGSELLDSELLDSELPTMPPGDLYSDEPEMESDLHLRQLLLLLNCLNWLWRDRTDYFATGNLTVYYSQKRIKTRDFRGPDFFVVQGVESRPRKSWMIWEEDGRYPDMIVEILSDTTAKVDRTTKKDLYQTTFRTPDYFWFDPYSLEFAGFCLNGGTYVPIQPNAQGWLWSAQLHLFLGVHAQQLRFFTPGGGLVPTSEEAALAAEAYAEQEFQRAEQAAQRAEQESQRAEQESQRAEQESQRAEQESQRAEQAAQRAEQESQRAEQESRRAEQESQRAEQESQRAERLAAKLRQFNIDPDQP